MIWRETGRDPRGHRRAGVAKVLADPVHRDAGDGQVNGRGVVTNRVAQDPDRKPGDAN
jgi:hypothetical protein